MIRSWVVLGIALLILPATAGAQIKKQSSGRYLFRAKLVKGQKMSYAIAMTVAGLGGTKSGFTISVLSVKNKVATAKMTMEAVKYGDTVVQKAQSMQGRFNDQMEPADAKSKEAFGQFIGRYPPYPVKIGDQWSTDMTFNSQGVTTPVKASYKFVGIKKVGAHQVAVLAMTLKGQVSGTGTTLLRLSDGSPESTTLNVSMTLAAQASATPQKIPAKLTMTRRAAK